MKTFRNDMNGAKTFSTQNTTGRRLFLEEKNTGAQPFFDWNKNGARTFFVMKNNGAGTFLRPEKAENPAPFQINFDRSLKPTGCNTITTKVKRYKIATLVKGKS